MNSQNHRIYRLDGIEIDTAQACLKRDGNEQHLRQQAFQVLIYLLENPQRLITKNELIEAIWQDTAVTDNALEQCLAEIRKVLGDDSRNPRFIKTVPRAGYRFIGPLEEVCLDPSEAVETKEVPAIVLAERRRKPVEVAEPQVLGTAKESARCVDLDTRNIDHCRCGRALLYSKRSVSSGLACVRYFAGSYRQTNHRCDVL